MAPYLGRDKYLVTISSFAHPGTNNLFCKSGRIRICRVNQLSSTFREAI